MKRKKALILLQENLKNQNENILNRFKEKAFARGANREIIKKCEQYLNLSLEDFIKTVLEAMQKISNELNL